MQTTTTAGNSQTYRFEASGKVVDIERELFVATAAMLTQKWPARDEGDHKFIAEKTTSLTRVLADTYRRDFLKEER